MGDRRQARAVSPARLFDAPEAMMSNSDRTALHPRRALFTGATAVGALATAALVLPGANKPASAPTAALTDKSESGGYQLTQHVQRYYQTAKI